MIKRIKFVRLLFAFLIIATVFPTIGLSQPGTWAISFGGDLQDYAEDILVDDAGNIYVSGFFRDTLDFGGGVELYSAGQTDAFMAKYNSSGNLVWANRYGWYNNEFAHGMAFDEQGDLLLVGEFQDSTIFGTDTLYSYDTLWHGAAAMTYDIFILELDTAGNRQKLLGGGWFGSENFYEVEVDSKGIFYFAGMFRTHNNFGLDEWGRGYDEGFVVRMDSLGQSRYTDVTVTDTMMYFAPRYDPFTYKTSASGEFIDRGTAFDLVGDSLVIWGGTFQDTCWFRDSTIYRVTDFEDDIFIVCRGDTGRFDWVVQGSGPGKEMLHGLVTDAQGNIYVGGYFDSTMTIGSTTLNAGGALDGYLLKLDLMGNVTWGLNLGGEGFDVVHDVELADNGNVLVTGYFQGTADIGGTMVSATDSSDQDMFVAAFDPAGNLLWVNTGGGPSLDAGKAIDVDGNGWVYVYGTYNSTASFGDADLSSKGSDDLFIIRMTPDGAVDRAPAAVDPVANLVAFPNPAREEVTLQFSLSNASDLNISLVDLQGRRLSSQIEGRRFTPGTHQVKLSLQGLSPGMYFYVVERDGRSNTGKLIVR